MQNKEKLHTAEKPALDKLAQLPTNGLESGNLGTLTKRARSKFYTQKIVYPLLYLVDTETIFNKAGKSYDMHKNYSHAYNCGNTITQRGNKTFSRYCNSRICHVCNRIRTAKLMNGYIQPLQELGTLQFTTLTIPNCKGEDLELTIEEMLFQMSKIVRVIRERRKIDISGMRKLEITYNSKTNTYHPHFHILHDKGETLGNVLIQEWLKRFPKAKLIGQNTKIADNGSLAELFKYTSKFVIKDNKEKNTLNIYVSPLNLILQTLYRKRTTQAFGKIRKIKINEPDEETITELVSQVIEDLEYEDEHFHKEWIWGQMKDEIDGIYNWVDANNKKLTDYKPPDINFQYFI